MSCHRENILSMLFWTVNSIKFCTLTIFCGDLFACLCICMSLSGEPAVVAAGEPLWLDEAMIKLIREFQEADGCWPERCRFNGCLPLRLLRARSPLQHCNQYNTSIKLSSALIIDNCERLSHLQSQQENKGLDMNLKNRTNKIKKVYKTIESE